jgi:hypothetical protein
MMDTAPLDYSNMSLEEIQSSVNNIDFATMSPNPTFMPNRDALRDVTAGVTDRNAAWDLISNTALQTDGFWTGSTTNSDARFSALQDVMGDPVTASIEGSNRYTLEIPEGFNSEQRNDYVDYLVRTNQIPGPGEGREMNTRGLDSEGRLIVDTNSLSNSESFGGKLFRNVVTTAIGAGTGAGVVGAVGGGLVGAGAGGAASSATTGLINEGKIDVGDMLTGAATGTVSAGLLDPYLPPAYSAQNIGGSFIKGSVNEGVNSLIRGDGLDLTDIALAGVKKAGFDTLKDLGGDALQTNDGNLQIGVDTVNGVAITQADIDRLTNTSDLYGVLGDNGLLSKIGITSSYMPTGVIGDIADWIGLGGRPVVDPGGLISKKAQEDLDGIGSDTSLSFEDRNEQIENVVNQYYTDTARYDERYFDLTTERSSDVSLSGIYEKNPYASGADTTFGIEGGSEGSLPGTSGSGSGMLSDYGQGDSVPAGSGGGDRVLPTGNGVSSESDITLPSTQQDTLPTTNTGGNTVQRDQLPTGTVDQPDEIPANKGGGSVAALGTAIAGGMMMTSPEFKPFMATIKTHFPVLSKLNLQPKDYLKMLIGRMNT